MNKILAKKIAEKITNKELLEMLINAQNNITDWKEISKVNKCITKGTAWNILTKDFNINSILHILTKINMIREFGKYLSEEFKKLKNQIPLITTLRHEDPIFIREELSYEDRVLWFMQNYYESGLEYEIMLNNFKNEDLDNLKWYNDIIKVPKYKNEL